MENVPVFVNESSRSSWTMLFGESGSPQKDELQGNSEFFFNITQKLILEHVEEILNVHTIESAFLLMDEIDSVS